MSQMGQKRHCGRAPTTSGLPRSADILRVSRHVSKVPQADIGDGFSALAGKSGKVRKYRCDEIAMMAVIRSQPRSI